MSSEVLQVIQDLERYKRENRLKFYLPYGHPDTLCPSGERWIWGNKYEGWESWSNKPWQLDFHAAGKIYQQRMSICANRVGKTQSASMEVAYHMTGLYPDWWEGKRFDEPVLVWTGSPTNETSRDIVQKALLGGTDRENLGTGSIPKSLLVDKPKSRQAGVSDVVDVFKCRHVSGGVSICTLKTFEQGWRKWQGTAPHIVWLDEEPEDNEVQGRIYSEALTRLLTSKGIMMVTFTPLLGQTQLVRHFQEGGPGIYTVTATWDDAPHLGKKDREELGQSYPDHELQARTRGVPMIGEGAVFTTPEEDIKIEPFEIPWYFARIKGIDFGIDHPWALSDCAWDRDKDIFYVIRVAKKKGSDTAEHSQEINRVDPWVPVSWPHDGVNKERSSGKQLKDFYRDNGVRILSMSARYDNKVGGAQAVEPIVEEVNQRAKSGRFFVFNTCIPFFDEYRNYHRKNGELIKINDDVLKSVFYALMMRRFAKTHHVKPETHSIPQLIRM